MTYNLLKLMTAKVSLVDAMTEKVHAALVADCVGFLQYSVTKAEPSFGKTVSQLFGASNELGGQEYQVLNGVQQGIATLFQTAQIQKGDTIYVAADSPHIDTITFHAQRLGATLTHNPKDAFKLAFISTEADKALPQPTGEKSYMPVELFSQTPDDPSLTACTQASRVGFPTIQVRQIGSATMGTAILLANHEVVDTVEKLMTFRMICPPPTTQKVLGAQIEAEGLSQQPHTFKLPEGTYPEPLQLSPNPIRAVIGLIEHYIAKHQGPPLLFASGYPNPGTFPTDKAATVVSDLVSSGHQFSTSPPQHLATGSESFIQQQHDYFRAIGITCAPDTMMVVNGGQEALGLLSQILLDGKKVAMDARSYGPFEGNLKLETHTTSDDAESLKASRDGLIKIAEKDGNMDLDDLEKQLIEHQDAKNPIDYLYVIPKGHNPNGGTLNKAEAQRLVGLAQKYGFTIIEDNPYGDIVYDREGAGYHYLKEFDTENSHVILLDSVSKKLAAGLRRCTIAGPAEQMRQLQEKRQHYTAHNVFMDTVTGGILNEFDLPAHVKMATQVYADRLGPLQEALSTHFPDAVPRGEVKAGMFIKLDISPLFSGKQRVDGQPLNTADILPIALDTEQLELPKGVAFIPLPPNELRLSFSLIAPEDIKDAVVALRKAVDIYVNRAIPQ